MFRPMFFSLLVLPIMAQATDNTGTYSRMWWGHKAFHFGAGFSIAWTGAKLKQPKLGLALGWAAGIAKEVADNRFGESKMSQRRDILITGAGATLGWWLATRPKDTPRPVDPVLWLELRSKEERDTLAAMDPAVREQVLACEARP